MKLEIGDKVKVVNYDPTWNGTEGIVTNYDNNGGINIRSTNIPSKKIIFALGSILTFPCHHITLIKLQNNHPHTDLFK